MIYVDWWVFLFTPMGHSGLININLIILPKEKPKPCQGIHTKGENLVNPKTQPPK